MKKIEVRICGSGGQGVVLAGQVLGRAAVYDGKNAVQTQSYGAEARGSAAQSEVIISDGKIGFPTVRRCDVLVAMNQEAVERNVKDLKDDGVLFVDSSTVKNVPEIKARIMWIPASQAAEKAFGEKLYANMIMLGALVKATGIVGEKATEKAIRDSVQKRAVNTNLLAYEEGKKIVL